MTTPIRYLVKTFAEQGKAEAWLNEKGAEGFRVIDASSDIHAISGETFFAYTLERIVDDIVAGGRIVGHKYPTTGVVATPPEDA